MRGGALDGAPQVGDRGEVRRGTGRWQPAVVSAVLDALAVRGVETIDMPLTPERIWRAAQPR